MKINGINHITFATANLETSIAFYQNILGFELAATWDSGAYLQSGELWLCLSFDEATKTEPTKDYSHIALNIDEADFPQFEQLISTHDIPIWKTNSSEGQSLYILDPDHNKLELHSSTLKSRLQHMQQHPYPGMKFH
tara:strand:- start:151280 stop:151690 length:411 start_codon:yes stop_codon:yes gene_type:complete